MTKKFLAYALVAILASAATYTCGSFKASSNPQVVFIERQELTGADKREIENVVRRSGFVNQINGGQAWEASGFTEVGAGGRRMVRFQARWSDPVTYSGPWRVLKCRGTRLIEIRQQFDHIRWVSLVVDGNEIYSHSISAPPEGEEGAKPANGSSVGWGKVYNTKNDIVVHRGPLPVWFNVCPPGTNYD